MARHYTSCVLSSLTIVFAACVNTGSTVTYGGGSSEVTIKGVVSSGGLPLSGAEVSLGESSAVTDSAGAFTLTGAPSGANAVVGVNAPGFAPQYAAVAIKAGVASYVTSVSMAPLQQTAVSPTSGATISAMAVGQMVQITVPAAAVPSTAGPLTLRVASYDYKDGPGTLTGTEADGTTNPLQSAGMFYVDVVDASGTPVQLNPGTGVQVTYPTFSMAPVSGAQPTQWWQFDSSAGNWGSPVPSGEPETGIQLTGMQPGTVFNCDRGFPGACVIGRLKSTGNSCSGQRVEAEGPVGTASKDYSGQDGSFCVLGPVGAQMSLSTGASLLGATTMASSYGDCSIPSSCLDLGDVETPAADCNEQVACVPACVAPQECLNGTCVSPDSCAGRCCPGRNDSCTLPDASCYCDDYCTTAGDCCPDFAASCGA